MPYIAITVQHRDFEPAAIDAMGRAAARAAADAEEIPDDPLRRANTVVQIIEAPAGQLYSAAGGDAPRAVRIVIAEVFVCEGVLDAAHRARCIRGIHAAIRDAGAVSGARGGIPVRTSIIVNDVTNGTWGIDGELQFLPDFAARAGYRHLALFGQAEELRSVK